MWKQAKTENENAKIAHVAVAQRMRYHCVAGNMCYAIVLAVDGRSARERCYLFKLVFGALGRAWRHICFVGFVGRRRADRLTKRLSLAISTDRWEPRVTNLLRARYAYRRKSMLVQEPSRNHSNIKETFEDMVDQLKHSTPILSAPSHTGQKVCLLVYPSYYRLFGRPRLDNANRFPSNVSIERARARITANNERPEKQVENCVCWQ